MDQVQGGPKKSVPVHILDHPHCNFCFNFNTVLTFQVLLAMSKKNSLWTVEMRAFAVEKYLETKSFDAAIRDFVTKFNPPKPPYKSLIVKWVAKFRTEGTVRNLNSITPGRNSHSGRKRKRNEEFIERLRESVQESPHKSTRRRYQELASSRSTMLRAIDNERFVWWFRGVELGNKIT